LNVNHVTSEAESIPCDTQVNDVVSTTLHDLIVDYSFFCSYCTSTTL
jgi:hypothetical protein